MRVKDQLGRKLVFKVVPSRIVSLVPSQTELLVDLGLGDSIVGVTKFCVHPVTIKKNSSIVGGTKNVDFEKILLLQPDIIICNKEENSKEIVDACQNIAPTWVSDIYTLEDNKKMIKSLGLLLNKKFEATSLNSAIDKNFLEFKKFMRGRRSKKVAYLIWKKPYMIAGQNTFINNMLELNNYENFAPFNSRYPEVDLKILKNLDLILLSTEPYPFKNKNVEELKNALQTEVRLVDGEYFSWYGSRIIKAFNYFKELHK